MKKALVTGGAGFVGSNIVKALLERNIEVKVLVLKDENTFNIDNLDVERVEGNLLNPDSLKSAVKGCDTVFHAAALHLHYMKDFSLMYKVNVDGTKNLFSVIDKDKIEKIIFTSTQNTIGLNKSGISNEDDEFNMFHVSSHYTKSKYLAETFALQSAKDGYPAVVVNPSGPFGEGDIVPGPTGKNMINIIKEKYPFFIDGTFNAIDVKDIAVGHILAAERGKIGNRYILGNKDITVKEFMNTICRLTNSKPPSIRLPYPVALTIAHVSEFITKTITKKSPILSITRVKQLNYHKKLDISRATSELGLKLHPVENAFQREIDFFRKLKLI